MRIGIDVNGSYDVSFADPRKTVKVFTLADLFLKQEDMLSASARTVYTEDIRTLLTASGAMLDLKSSGESQRVQSSEEIKALDKQAVAFAKKIHRTMNYEFGDTPAQAADWGFDIKQTGKRKGTILMPDGRAAIVAMLDRYVKTEKGRAAADRFKSPALADVQAVVDGLKENVGTRGTAKSQRVSGTQQSIDTATKLLDLLQGAAVQIVLKQFDGKVTPDLAQWGFDVTARTKSAAKTKTSKPPQPA